MFIRASKQKILIICLIVLLLLAFSYISWQLLIRVRNAVFLQGYTLAIEQIITEAEKEGCQPFPIFSEEKVIHLMNTECLEPEEEKIETP